MSELKRDVIYVDLDALLDTRLGCLATIRDEYAFNAMKGDYFTRESDTFPDMSLEDFKEVYALRDMTVLKRSILTNVIFLLSGFVKSSMEESVTGGQNLGLEVSVNTYPYEMAQEERLELIQLLQLKLGPQVEVSAIHLSNEQLTPEVCKENYQAMVRYSFHDWVQIHLEAWKKTKMPSVAFYAPALYAKIPTNAEITELRELKLNPFQATELACAPLFALRLLEPNMFSIHDGIKARKGITLPGSDVKDDPITPEGDRSPP